MSRPGSKRNLKSSESFSQRLRRSLFAKSPSQLADEANTGSAPPVEDQWSPIDPIPWMDNPEVESILYYI